MRPSMQILPAALAFAVADKSVIARLSPLDRNNALTPGSVLSSVTSVDDQKVEITITFTFNSLQPPTIAQSVTVTMSWTLDDGFVTGQIS